MSDPDPTPDSRKGLHLFVHPGSQPARAVFWACLINETPFHLRLSQGTDLATVNPRGQLPALLHDGFRLAEMPAMLSYLADTFGWQTWYPPERQTRSRIDQYLHMHHGLTRIATLKLMAPHVQVAFGGPPTSNPLSTLNDETVRAVIAADDPWATGHAPVAAMLDFLEAHWFDSGDFIAGAARPSIADIACYEEVAQLRWAGLHEFSEQPRISAWLERMRELAHHDAAHTFNATLGNVREQPLTLERFMVASTTAVEALRPLTNVVD